MANLTNMANRQKLRLTILFLIVITFPILMNYMSVFLIIEGSSKGVMTFSFFFWTAWVVSAFFWVGRRAGGCARWGLTRKQRTGWRRRI